jgi:hypothetical protein
MATELFVFAHLPTTGFVPAGRADLRAASRANDRI